MSFSKYFTKEKNAVPSLTSKLKKVVPVLLLMMMLVIMKAGEVNADRDRYDGVEWWQQKVRKLKAEGKDVKIIRSKSKKPEKSPEEFLKRYRKVREQAGDNFTFQTFVEEVARGLVIEQRYHETQGVLYIAKDNLNPNYYFRNGWQIELYPSFDHDKFCITPELLRKTFGKEDRIVTYQTKKTESYRYYFMGMNFEIDFISSINKKCANEAIFNSDFFSRMEK